MRQRAAGLALAWGVLLVACTATRPDPRGSIEPRFVAVHNALAALGLAQVGPIQQGVLGPAGESQVRVSLPAGCVTVVAFGSDGLRDVDATLLDPHGAPVAHDTTGQAQAVMHTCLETPDTYVVALKAAAGAGPWVLATWAGAAATAAGAVTDTGPPPARGTCDAPLPLSVGTVTGSTAHGDFENTGSCGPSDSRELVYELDVHERERVTLSVEAKFDTVLYVRKDTCGDPATEVDCNDDAPDRNHSRVEHVLDPGKYFVFVDGYGHESGAFKLTVSVAKVLALADECQGAPRLTTGPAQAGTTDGAADDAEASCGSQARGAEVAWQMDLGVRSRVRLVEHSDDMAPVVHVRHACADERSEVACADTGAAPGDATITGLFSAGSYAVFADGRDPGSAGAYTLAFETAPPSGTGVGGDSCSDAMGLGSTAVGKIAGDTFAARDDFTGTCGGAGAPDVAYRLDVARRSRLTASLEAEEGSHVIAVTRRCGDKAAEVECGRSVDQVLAPGGYFVVVDGVTPESFGRFTLQWSLRDLTGQAAACASAVSLVEGRVLDATTAGGGDRFAPSCGSSDGVSGPDRAFELVLASRRTVRLEVNPAFDAAVSLRRSCSDQPGAPNAEIACETSSEGNRRVVIERTLDAGSYWLVVDGQTATDQGSFTVGYRTR